MSGASRTLDPVDLIHVEMEVGGILRPVGDIARRNRTLYFAYDPAFRALGLELSPFRLRPGVALYEGPRDLFDGLHGVFNDSLPDGWGRLLLDRKLWQGGILPGSLTPLDRLAMVGSRGMGALATGRSIRNAPTVKSRRSIWTIWRKARVWCWRTMPMS